jgi:2-polyprenyl-3-methyl-5-hydroxy-6-metoxy-1,4-benzoquinol methylase
MKEDMQSFVKRGYEEGDYIGTYERTKKRLNPFEIALFKEMFSRIPKKGSILDLGCGAGVPYDRYLINKGYNVTGIDFCKKHIELAKRLVPGARFIYDDITRHKFQAKYDAITSIYTLFHIHRSKHKEMFRKIFSLLKKRGIILITLGTDNLEQNVEDFVGSKMAWSAFDVPTYNRMIEQAGFKIIASLELNRRERHLWILASKEYVPNSG